MKTLALYGYGTYGKRASESFLKYWCGEYKVTAIFDRNPAGKRDMYWDLPVLASESIREEFVKGVFEAVMICIAFREELESVEKQLTECGIPVIKTGSPEDFADPDDFEQESDPEITLHSEGYKLHVYKNMLGAAADFNRSTMLFLFSEAGKLSVEHYRKYLDWFEAPLISYPFRLRDPLPERIRMPGDWCFIAGGFVGNYWHFTFETADCIYLLESAGYRGKYLYTESPYADEILRLLDVSPDRLIRISDLEIHKVYVFERMFMINAIGVGKVRYHPDVIAGMAAAIQKKLNRDPNSPRKIYVKRIGSRKLLNGEETLRENGFTVIIPEKYSVREQMELFHNADIVICPHGANSTNCLYMRKGTVFAEIFSDKWDMVINEDACEALGIHWLKLMGKACGSGQDGRFADYTVDEEELRQLIREAERIFASGNSG